MTFHTSRRIERKIKPRGRTNQKSFLSNPMITACPEHTAETAWFFATRGDASLPPRKIFLLNPTYLHDICTSVQSQRVDIALNKALNQSPSFSCTSVHTSPIPPIPSLLVQVLEYLSPLVECVGVWGVLAFSALPRTFSMVSTMKHTLNYDRPILDMTHDTPYIYRTNYIQNSLCIKRVFRFVRTIDVTYTLITALQSHIELDTDPTYCHT
jgi:hypothetical protein